MRHKQYQISTFCSTMSYFIFPDLSLVIVFLTFYIFRNTSLLSLPWFWLVSPMGRSPISLALENYTIWLSLYSLAHLILYVEPQRSLVHPFKLNPNYPRHQLIVKEVIKRCCYRHHSWSLSFPLSWNWWSSKEVFLVNFQIKWSWRLKPVLIIFTFIGPTAFCTHPGCIRQYTRSIMSQTTGILS